MRGGRWGAGCRMGSIGVERQPGLGLGCLSVENKRNRFIVGGGFFLLFLVCIFLKNASTGGRACHPHLYFCHLHELIRARRQLTVASARMHAWVPGRAPP